MSMRPRKRRNSGIISLLLVLAILGYFHNFAVASRSKARDFDYAAWQTLTKSTAFFNDVKTKDVFISLHQNDAYETNAGSFYYNTGIRLAQLFNTTIIWPNYSNCLIESTCKLPNVRHQVLTTLPNFNRGEFVPTRRSEQQKYDWVGLNSKPGALAKSKIWDFDEYPITDSTMIAYLAPYDEAQTTASIWTAKLNFVTISKRSSPILNPSLNGYCLVPKTSSLAEPRSELRIKYWRMPELDKDRQPLPNTLDIRSMAVGTC